MIFQVVDLSSKEGYTVSSTYNFTVEGQQGNNVSFADYRGRVLLLVNTATECGFTLMYAQLQELYTNLYERGFDILDFPCDQFGHQALVANEEIAAFCTSRFDSSVFVDKYGLVKSDDGFYLASGRKDDCIDFMSAILFFKDCDWFMDNVAIRRWFQQIRTISPSKTSRSTISRRG